MVDVSEIIKSDKPPTLVIEELIRKIAKERNIAIPVTSPEEIHGYAGGFVLEPKVIGVVKEVAIFDMSRYYPSLIQTFNISPETTRIVVPSGLNPIAEFSFDKKGLIPLALEELDTIRSELEDKLAQMSDVDPEYLGLKREREKIKILQNSVYGALANENFFLFSRGLAALVTSLGREGIKELIAECERARLEVYGADTDSLMVKIPFEKAEELSKDLTQHIQSYFKKKYDLPTKSYLRLKFSRYAKSVLFLSKKNYAFIDRENKLEVVGLIRQARSRFADQFQKEFYWMVLEGGNTEEIQTFLIESITKFREAPLEDIAYLTKINQPLDQYRVGSFHIRAAKNAELLYGTKWKMGDEIKLLWLKDRVVDIVGFKCDEKIPEDFREKVDYERMEEQLRSLAEPIFQILGKKTKQKTLF